ncbi:ABC multidrug transporter A-1 [Paramyrothecium foliicola]|nr:ABC multidrug transporter A-1 [Paramyrothecium foliicola]
MHASSTNSKQSLRSVMILPGPTQVLSAAAGPDNTGLVFPVATPSLWVEHRVSRTFAVPNLAPGPWFRACVYESQFWRLIMKPTEAAPGPPSSSDNSVTEQAAEEAEIHTIARQVTKGSQAFVGISPFNAEKESALDPESANFDSRKWATSFYNTVYGSEASRVVGIAYKKLDVYGYGSETDYQQTVGNTILKLPASIYGVLGIRQRRVDILHSVEGLVRPGEMLCVLGPPGSGCSTLLKTISGDTYGLNVADTAEVNYSGITPKAMHSRYRGEAIYTAEVDNHFPALSVDTTLTFAARARAPYALPEGISRNQYADHMRDVMMALFGISHIKHTKVGNDFVRGVSGGERKRVTIAEAALSGAPLQCWDNSTRGLDSANAVEFCRTLRTQSDVFGVASAVAIYQAPQGAYNYFDKVCVLYEGRQIYFGPARRAKSYFERLGFVCPEGQTEPDFLTSMSNAAERVAAAGSENKVPRTAQDFEQAWLQSEDHQQLIAEIDSFNSEHPPESESSAVFSQKREAEKSSKQRKRSPFTMSYGRQIQLCLWREWQRLKCDPSVTIAMLGTNFFEVLIVASIFYNLGTDTSSLLSRGTGIFLVVLLNAFASLLEIISLYAKRSIVEKHKRYTLYHPSADAIASIIMDMPYKMVNAILVNTTFYFMANLRREPGPFFFFLFNMFLLLLSMSMFFRTFASLTKTLEQALAPAGILLMAMVLYTGFAIPVDYMRGWASWLRWLNPVFYGIESAMINEFNGRSFECSQLVPAGPGYDNITLDERVCAVKGSVPGQRVVQGADWLQVSYGYVAPHKWRNIGILFAFAIGLCIIHLILSELVAAARSRGEVLVFKRGSRGLRKAKSDKESGSLEPSRSAHNIESNVAAVEKQTSILHWQNLCYTVKTKEGDRTILDNVDGWVKPGTLTALMGVSGAGKTTLLDVLASRVSVGVVTGDIRVDGCFRDSSFQRKTGYAQQQDLHLPTTTVREALEFSALLRQPPRYSREEKLSYVENVISLLGMEEYADAVVGVPGEGLNVEQRKRLTIGVELAARPSLLVFLDEPTSGLDSQTSWSICDLLEKLARSGQAVLCTIHQPSAILFQRFDRLLLLAKGGRTVYFGDIGSNSSILLDYFRRKGGAECPPEVNPAEYMLETIGAAPGARTDIDWPAVWRSSEEYGRLQAELGELTRLETTNKNINVDASDFQEFAAPFSTQLWEASKRTYQQYWRSPSYIFSKALLCIGTSFFIGFSFFKSPNTQQGLQNQFFGVLMFIFVIINLILQIIPIFVVQRTLYEARERQCRTYHWAAFVISQIVTELSWNTVMAVFSYLVWYYPVGFYKNAQFTDSMHARGGLTLLIIWTAFLFGSTFAHVLIAGIGSSEEASALANLFGIMMYAFCGILVPKTNLPGFWIFMYRVNPFTYLVGGFTAATLGQAPVTCADDELLRIQAPSSGSCKDFLSSYLESAGGYLAESQPGGDCLFCPVADTDSFLARSDVQFSDRWRNFGLMWVYIGVNIFLAMTFYWLLRVPKKKKTT